MSSPKGRADTPSIEPGQPELNFVVHMSPVCILLEGSLFGSWQEVHTCPPCSRCVMSLTPTYGRMQAGAGRIMKPAGTKEAGSQDEASSNTSPGPVRHGKDNSKSRQDVKLSPLGSESSFPPPAPRASGNMAGGAVGQSSPVGTAMSHKSQTYLAQTSAVTGDGRDVGVGPDDTLDPIMKRKAVRRKECVSW